MTHIMLCDDKENITNSIEKLICDYNKHKRCSEQIVVYKYNNSQELLDRYTSDQSNLLFLDIDMKPLTGIELANKIRALDIKCTIVFLTAHRQHMNDGFKLHAFDYLVKPVTKEVLWKALDEYFMYHKDAIKHHKFYFRYTNSNKEYQVDTDLIFYLEKCQNQLLIHLESSKIEVYCTLSDALEQLTSNFFMCHKSYIVNIDKIIKKEREKSILLNKAEVPIGRGKLVEFKKYYMSYLDPFKGDNY